MTLGEIIKFVREHRGLHQKELATICSCSANAMGLYERGIVNPPFDTVVKIANLLNVDIGMFADESVTEKNILDRLHEKPIEKSPFQVVLEDVKTACENLGWTIKNGDVPLECATKIYIAQMQKEGEQK